MMDVEIDDRHPLGPVRRPGVTRGDGGVIEEAEPHRGRDFGVMAGGARGDEGVHDLAGHHLVDREDGPARRAQGGLDSPGRHRRVSVEPLASVIRLRGADRLDIILRMNPRDRGEVGAGRRVARQHLKGLVLKRAFDRPQAVGPLGMALAHVVREAGGVGDEERGHGPSLPPFSLAWRFYSPRSSSALSRPSRRKSNLGRPRGLRGWLIGPALLKIKRRGLRALLDRRLGRPADDGQDP